MRRHNHKIRSEPLLRGIDQIPRLSNFDGQLTSNPRRYALGILFEPAAGVFDLRIIKVFAGVSLSCSLSSQWIYLQDMQ